MTSICRAKLNPYLYTIRVPNNSSLSFRRREIRKCETFLNNYAERFPWLSVFGYQDFISTTMSTGNWLTHNHLESTLGGASAIIPNFFSIGESAEVIKEKEKTYQYMVQVINQPICIHTIQTETLGVLPFVNERLRLFQD